MDKHQLIAKYGKKFVGTSEATPVLRGVHYAADGSVYATNRHYGLVIRNAHSFSQAMTLDTKTGIPIEGVYPDMSRIFLDISATEIKLLPAELESVVIRAAMAADIAKRINKKIPIIKLKALNGSVNLFIKNEDLEFNAFFGNVRKHEDSIRSLNAEYLLTALQLFADAGRGVTVKLNGPLAPIVLTDDEDVHVILLPFRTTD